MVLTRWSKRQKENNGETVEQPGRTYTVRFFQHGKAVGEIRAVVPPTPDDSEESETQSPSSSGTSSKTMPIKTYPPKKSSAFQNGSSSVSDMLPGSSKAKSPTKPRGMQRDLRPRTIPERKQVLRSSTTISAPPVVFRPATPPISPKPSQSATVMKMETRSSTSVRDSYPEAPGGSKKRIGSLASKKFKQPAALLVPKSNSVSSEVQRVPKKAKVLERTCTIQLKKLTTKEIRKLTKKRRRNKIVNEAENSGSDKLRDRPKRQCAKMVQYFPIKVKKE